MDHSADSTDVGAQSLAATISNQTGAALADQFEFHRNPIFVNR